MKQGKRFGLSAEQKLDVWRRWKTGQTLHEIGRAFGKDHHNSIRCVVSLRGRIAPAVRRREISRGLASGSSIREIAKCLEVLVASHFVGWLGAGLELNPSLVLVWKALQWPTAIFFVALSCSLIYYYGPDLKERRRWHWFTPGAAFGGFICGGLVWIPYVPALF